MMKKGKRSVKWSLTGTLYSLHLQYKLVFNRGYHSFYTPKHIEKAPPDLFHVITVLLLADLYFYWFTLIACFECFAVCTTSLVSF